MKKILILTALPATKHLDLYAAAAQENEVELVMATYEEILTTFTANTMEITVADQPLHEFQVVFLRTISRYLELTALIEVYCQKHSISIVDAVHSNPKSWIDRKSFEYSQLVEKDVPIIPSFLVTQHNYRQLTSQQLAYPLIVKETDASKGKGVHLIDQVEKIGALFESTQKPTLLVQPFIENEYDIRVLVLGGVVLGAIKRSRTDENEFRNNVSLGGNSTVYQLSEKEAELALRATEALNYSFSGVDILQAKDGRQFILEVNKAPQYNGFMEATGMNVPAKIIEYLAGL
jgi:RimK family alpha-L-glutamate ligase